MDQIRKLISEREELEAEEFLIEETILLSPINEEDERRLREQLTDIRAKIANVNWYLIKLYAEVTQ